MKRRATAWFRCSIGRRRCPSKRSAIASISCCEGARRRRWSDEMSLYASGNQTVGPYLHIGLDWLVTRNIAGPGIKGERFALQGRLLDGNGAGVSDGLIEIWQANSFGKYPHPEDQQKKPIERGFRGFGRVPTDAKGGFRLSSIKP